MSTKYKRKTVQVRIGTDCHHVLKQIARDEGMTLSKTLDEFIRDRFGHEVKLARKELTRPAVFSADAKLI